MSKRWIAVSAYVLGTLAALMTTFCGFWASLVAGIICGATLGILVNIPEENDDEFDSE